MPSASAAPKSKQLLLELSLAVILAVVYYFSVKNQAFGTTENTTNPEIFVAASASSFQLEHIQDVWKGRVSSLLCSGGLFDLAVNHGSGSYEQFRFVFGFYQAAWLFLLFLLIILTLRHSLFINLGIFAGVMYDFLPASGLYFYPWDLPATFFFTLAVLLFERRHMTWLVAAVCAGSFFKETVLVCALLVFFAETWPWWKRVAVFCIPVAVYVIGKKLFLYGLHAHAAALSMNDSKELAGIFQVRVLLENLGTLVSVNGLYVLFANAGTLAAALCFGWQKRFRPALILILAFLAGQAMYGAFLEFRIFMQVLPLSLMILAERWWQRPPDAQPDTKKKSPKPAATIPVPTWTTRPAMARLKPAAITIIVLTSLVIGLQYYTVTARENRTAWGNQYTTDSDDFQDLERFAGWLRNGLNENGPQVTDPSLLVSQNPQLAMAWYWFGRKYFDTEAKIADTYSRARLYPQAHKNYVAAYSVFADGYTNALTANNFAWLLATCPDPSLRSGPVAVHLAGVACDATGYRQPVMIGTLAAAYAEAGQFSNAVASCRQARDLAQAQGNQVVADANTRLLQWYEAGKPFHEDDPVPPPKPAP